MAEPWGLGTVGRMGLLAKQERRVVGGDFVVDGRKSLFYLAVRGALRLFLRVWFRPWIEMEGRVPASGAVILAPVHRSNLDFCFAFLLTDRKIFFMAKDSLWSNDLVGRLFSAMGAFPVNRESADRAALRTAEEVLDAGHVLVVFPEGSRRDGDLVGEILGGVSLLAARTGARTLPLGIGGSRRAMPKGALFPRPFRVRLVLGEMLPGLRGDGKSRVGRSAREAYTESVRSAIQVAYDKARG